MEFNKQTVKALLGVVCGGIAFAPALLHLDVVAGAAGWLLGICPRCCWAVPSPLSSMSPCGRWSAACFPMQKKANKLRRPLALLLTVAAVSAVLALAGMVIVPGVGTLSPPSRRRYRKPLSACRKAPPAFRNTCPFWQTRSKGCLSTGPVFPKGRGAGQNWGKGLLISGGGLVSGIVSGVTTFSSA